MKYSSFENNFLLKASLVSYLFPAVIVAVNVGLTSALHSHETDQITDWIAITDEHDHHHSLYTSQYFCFLHSNSLYFGFITEIVFVLISTIAAYLYIVYKITNTEESQETADPAINDCSKFYLQRAVTNCLSMAVCWLLIIPVALTSQDDRFGSITTYIFTVYASFHALLMFYLMCLYEEKVRNLLCIWRKKKNDAERVNRPLPEIPTPVSRKSRKERPAIIHPKPILNISLPMNEAATTEHVVTPIQPKLVCQEEEIAPYFYPIHEELPLREYNTLRVDNLPSKKVPPRPPRRTSSLTNIRFKLPVNNMFEAAEEETKDKERRIASERKYSSVKFSFPRRKSRINKTQ
ncbi:uncharacterized protein LOC144748812 [Ciona intestinalis]